MVLSCPDLQELLRAQLGSAFRCNSSNGRLNLIVPFLHADGDFVSIHAVGNVEDISLTDLGATLSRLRQMGLEPRRTRLDSLLGRLGVQLSGEALTITTTREGLLNAVLMMGQAVSSLAAISFAVNTLIEPFVEIEQYISEHHLSAKKQYRLSVNVPTSRGTVPQHPMVDLLLQDNLIVMTVPGNKARLRKVNSTFKTLTVLEKAAVTNPRITVYDSKNPLDRDDALLLQDLTTLIPSNFLKASDPSYSELEALARSRESILPPALL